MSNVIKNKRSLSDFEFKHNLGKMHKEMTNLLLRDFGVKKIKVEGKEPENPYPEWLFNKYREGIIDLLFKIDEEIERGNSIFPTTYAELERRRLHQDEAIGGCFALLSQMKYIVDVIAPNGNISKCMPYVDMIKREISLLKGWRKSSNKFKKLFKNKN